MSNGKPDGQQPPRMPAFRFPMFLLLIVGLAFLLSGLRQPIDVRVDINEFRSMVDSGTISAMTISGNSISGERTDGSRFALDYPVGAIDSDFVKELHERVPDAVIIVEKPSVWVQLMVMMLPWLLIFAVVWFMFLRPGAKTGGSGLMGGFGRSRHSTMTAEEDTNVTFDDVAGIEEAKEEVSEIVEFLKSPKRFTRLGGRVPHGVLLVGAPGCGKTLLAKAIAGEANVPFLSVTGSDFVEMFVGVGASRVRNLFEEARQRSPCIIFIDEIDAVGRKRGNFSGGHDEREQTLNAVLVEMDGFKNDEGVIVLAATNRADILDPALVRPGRFDRQVHVPAPDVDGRLAILGIHVQSVVLGPDVDLRRMARGTPMFSGADLEALVNEAAIVATMKGNEHVGQDDFEEARDKIKWGKARKSHVATDEERRLTAYHEAGHAIVQALEEEADPIHKVSIIPRGPFGGATFSLPERDRTYYTKRHALAMLRVMLGGRVAEEEFLGDISSGASSDICQATALARRMVEEWGMDDEIGFVHHGTDGEMWSVRPSPDTARRIEEQIKRLVDVAKDGARQTIKDALDKCEEIAKALLEYETITGDEVTGLVEGRPIDRPEPPLPTTVPPLCDRSVVDDLLDGANG